MKKHSGIPAVVFALAFVFAGTDVSAFGNMSMPMGGKAETKGPVDKTPVEKAKGPDSYTIAEIHKNGADLDRKKVVVRGRVTKVSKGIMKRNWVHLYDGTGEASNGTNDLVATSQENPSVGDVVTASGILCKDKDFGAGYKYSVIVEDATLKP